MRVSVSVCVCVCMCQPASISPELHVRSSPIFGLLSGHRSVLLRRRCHMLFTSGFTDDVVFALMTRDIQSELKEVYLNDLTGAARI